MSKIKDAALFSFFILISAMSAPLKAADLIPIEYFGRLPALKQVRAAPGGGFFSAQVNDSGFYVSSVYRLENDGSVRAIYGLKENDERWVRRFRWVNPDRLVVSIGFNSKRFGTDTVETRLFGLTPSEGELKALFRHSRDEISNQFEDNIVSYLDTDPDHILVSYSTNAGDRYPDVFKVPTNKRGRHKRVQGNRAGITNWGADADGNVRLGVGFKTRQERERRLIIKSLGNSNWLDISHRVASGQPDFVVRGFSNLPNIAYVESTHEHDTGALYEYDIEKDVFTQKIFHDPAAEIGGILIDRKGRLRGIGFGEELDDVEWLDPEIQSEVERMQRSLPGKAVSLVRESIDANFAVYNVSAVTEPSSYFIRDRAKGILFKLASTYPELEDVSLAPVIPVNYAARDGLNIPAYITLPFGMNSLDDLKSAPFVILPHGGPTARDFRGFDYWAQFFASRGYGVLQMNFRGSAGFGQAFREAGDREWGQAMQDDITDGVRWLIENGYADASRVAIVGGSYGGYAALMGAVKTPDLYQCAVSFAGVSDLPDVIRRARDYVGGKAGTQHIGRLWKDRAQLRENSPSRRAADINIPILLIHGEDDRVVDVVQSRRMNRVLQREGKSVKYLELEKGTHHLSIEENRMAFLRETEAFLGNCIGQD